jgi:hypothetical protein
MIKFSLLLIVCLTGCWTNWATVPPRIATSKPQVKVGELFEITITNPSGVFRGNANLTFVTRAFIYSPQNTPLLLAPYDPLSTGGFEVSTLPELFPLASSIEVVTPSSTNPSVPSLQVTSVVASLPQATFTLKAVSVGIAVIRGGFLVNSTQYPDNYTRLPPFLGYDGEITIQVVP